MSLDSTIWNSRSSLIRWFAGVTSGSASGRLKAAIIQCQGEGLGVRCVGIDAISMPSDWRTGRPADAILQSLTTLFERAFPDVEESPASLIDCIGLGELPADICIGSLASQVARATGITVVSEFADADIAAGGQGQPLHPAPDWLLFHSSRTNRALVHLGHTLRVTLLSAGAPVENTLCFDAGPCGCFLDALATQLSQGQLPFDPSGHFAVQGRRQPALIEQWRCHPFLLRRPPRFLTEQDFHASFRETSLAFARERQLSARDVLCTANHFVIDNLVYALRAKRELPQVDEVIVSGGGVRNGLLWKLIQKELEFARVVRSDDCGLPSDARPAVHAALLAFCMMENLPANLPHLTGAAESTILGRVTPGDPENWDRWTCSVADRFDLAENARAA